MKFIAVPVGGEWVIFRADQALGEDAIRIQGVLESAKLEDRSVSVGESRREAQHALTKLWLAWQTGDGVRVEGATLRYAREFLGALPDHIPVPDVYADNDGEVVFEWDIARRWVLAVSVSPDGTLTYAGLFGIKEAHGTETLAGSIPRAIAERIALVAQRTSAGSVTPGGGAGAIPLPA